MVMEKGIDRCLGILRKWAEARIATGNEPPWAWFQYMKLIETVAAIQIGRAAVTPTTGGSSMAMQQPGRAPKRDGVATIGKGRRRRRDEEPPLPM